ncbi:MAG: HNH endonuclease family protein [Candidatus Microsaccharimonas sp.]
MRRRRAIIVFSVGMFILMLLGAALPQIIEESVPNSLNNSTSQRSGGQNDSATISPALEALEKITVKGRAPKTGYERSQFGNGWSVVNGCSTRNIILYRDLENTVVDEKCVVVSGVLQDPYSGKQINFTKENSSDVQIDHVIALSDAWQKGAQLLTREQRVQLANDPLELLAVAGADNQAKSDGDAATWLPKNKAFRCEYIARQIAIKIKYSLWVTRAEKDVMSGVLKTCPQQVLP